MRAASQLRQAEAVKDTKRKLNKNRKRIAELDGIIKKLYESFAVGRIPEERFDSLFAEYDAEQKALQASVQTDEAMLSSFEEDSARIEQFMALAKRHTDFSELTTPMLNEFVEKILVHAPEKVDGDRVQEVEIYLKFIGKFDVPMPEPTEEELRRQEQLKKHRMKSRERYRQIKDGVRIPGELFRKKCVCCGKEFESMRSNAVYCSPACQQKYYRQKSATIRSRECSCENCGKVFTTTRNSVKYCCEDCRMEANRQMQRKRYLQKRQEISA